MPRNLGSFSHIPQRFALMLLIVAAGVYLAWPGQHVNGRLRSSAKTAKTLRDAKTKPITSTAAQAPGAISFAASSFSAKEVDGSASITLTRTGGSDNQVVAKVSLTDVTTNAADYRFTPGAVDGTFKTNPGPNSHVESLLVQPDGKIIIGGFFTAFGQATRNNIARLNSDGSLDTAFAPPITNEVTAMALQPDGKIIVVGSVSPASGAARTGILRLNANGSLDNTFNPGTGTGDYGISALALQSDGKIIIGGNFPEYNGTPRTHIARLNSDGSLDTTFNPGAGPNGTVTAVAVQPDNKVIIGGNFSQVNGVNRLSLARLNADGSYDSAFNSSPFIEKIFVRAITLQPDGKVLVGGGFYSNITFTDTNPTSLARVEADGSIDSSFVDPGLGKAFTVGAIKQQPDGKILVGGRAISVPNANVNQYLNRLNANGGLDPSFKSGATGFSNSALESLAMQGDGKIIVGGQFSTTPNNSAYYFLARLEGDIFVTWEAGDSVDKTFTLPVIDDFVDESDETLTLTLTPLTGGAFAGTHASATLTIIDAPPTLTQLSMSGEPGDYISGANSYFYTQSDTAFGASAADNSGDGLVDTVNISVNQADFTHWWYLDFNTHRMPGNLVPGYYANAERAPFTSNGHPGLSIYGDGRGCNTSTGSFTVHEAQFDYSGPTPKVIKFTASFEQHCEGGAAALVGTIYYRYTIGSGPTYTLTGQIVDTSGNALSNIPVNLGGSQMLTTNTDGAGNYSFANLLGGGNFFVTPTAPTTHIFSPTNRLIKVLGSGNQTANFTGIPLYSITGKVTDNNGAAMNGVQVRLTGTKTATVFTDNSGNYSFTDLRSDGNYTVTPTRQFYSFAPVSQTYATLSGNQTLNFTGTRLTFSIGGRVVNDFGIGISGITINLSGTQTATMQTDSMGNYLFPNLPAGGNYGLTAVRPNYTFTPTNQSVFGLNSNFTSVNFTGRLVNYNISGVVLDGGGNPMSNVTLTLSGSRTGATTTNTNGAYSFIVPAEGNYTVTPSRINHAFTPASRTFNNLSGNQPANFIGSLAPLQLILDTSGPDANQAAALDAILFMRDPFPVINAANLLDQASDPNTRVMLFLMNLQLEQGETAANVLVNLTDGSGQVYEVGAEDVRLIPLMNFTQLKFRLPDSLSSGVCTIKVKAHGRVSNSGTIRIQTGL